MLSFFMMWIMEDLIYTFEDLLYISSWEELIALPTFGKMVLYASIFLILILSAIFNFIFYRIMRPLAVFIMARHAGYRHAWVAFVPYGTYYLEFVLPIRDFNIFNWIKTEKRESIAWIYIANDLLFPIIDSILGLVPLFGTVVSWAYQLFVQVWKWRRIYDLMKTFGFKKHAMVWSILSVLCKPLYVVLLFVMCDKEPGYGWGRFDCPIMISYDGEIID